MSYLSKVAYFDLLNLYLAPPFGVIPFEFRLDLWHLKTRVSGLLYALLCNPEISHFDTIPACDRR